MFRPLSPCSLLNKHVSSKPAVNANDREENMARMSASRAQNPRTMIVPVGDKPTPKRGSSASQPPNINPNGNKLPKRHLSLSELIAELASMHAGKSGVCEARTIAAVAHDAEFDGANIANTYNACVEVSRRTGLTEKQQANGLRVIRLVLNIPD